LNGEQTNVSRAISLQKSEEYKEFKNFHCMRLKTTVVVVVVVVSSKENNINATINYIQPLNFWNWF
jgi:hypothetical protein